ncbi:tetratricopeptide repeat protein [Kitasatospora sp. NPDC088160]|uniref:tetratricopeptide repeat protein n=1 Tax=Kitasatospora sp. NPDC088160 TaxID=3364072 RepID=UPI00382DCE90
MGGIDEQVVARAELCDRLEGGLARRRLTKTQLANRVKLSRTTVHTAFQLTGPVPSAATVAALARALCLSADELLGLRRVAAGEAELAHGVEEGLGRPIAEWDPHDLEVHPAGTVTVLGGSSARVRQVLPGYVGREHDKVLTEAVRDTEQGRSRIVVLVGWSSTGKTRACWEAVQPLGENGWRLWHPNDPIRAEAAVADLERVQPRTVVWLNEAQHYLGDPQRGERITAALHSLLTDPNRAPVLVLGTLWPNYCDQYTKLPFPGAADPHSRTRELLAGRTYTVPEAFDSEALRKTDDLARAGDQLLFDALTRARAHGRVAQDLAGAPELLRRYEHATPAARALLEAAMDARRLGVGLHLPQAFLTEAATDYLTDDEWDRLTEDWIEAVEAAYTDLAIEVHGKHAPLRRTTPRAQRRPPVTTEPVGKSAPEVEPVFRLADFLEQYGRTDRYMLCPPASFWHAAHTHLTQLDVRGKLAVAVKIRHRLQWAHHLTSHTVDPDTAEAILQKAPPWQDAVDRQTADDIIRIAAEAGFYFDPTNMARLREWDGDWQGAETMYRKGADEGDLNAFAGLARLREEAGDREGAEAVYREAIDNGHVFAYLRLARLREEAGDREGAEALYRQGADEGDFHALSDLARLRERAGERMDAEALFRQAADAGDEAALVCLAVLRDRAGDREGAEALCRQVGRARLLIMLAWGREVSGDRKGAEALYREASDVGITASDYWDPGSRHMYTFESLVSEGNRTEAAIPAPWSGLVPGFFKERWPYGLGPDGTPTAPWP